MAGVPWIHETCGRCGRQLKTEKSKERGYGPVCYEKAAEEREKSQISLYDYIKK